MGQRAVFSLPLTAPACAGGGEQRDVCWAGPGPPCSWSRSSLFNPLPVPFFFRMLQQESTPSFLKGSLYSSLSQIISCVLTCNQLKVD